MGDDEHMRKPENKNQKHRHFTCCLPDFLWGNVVRKDQLHQDFRGKPGYRIHVVHSVFGVILKYTDVVPKWLSFGLKKV